jgi:hypothetical protein
MSKRLFSGAVLAAVFSVVTLTASQGSSTTMPAVSGKAWSASDASCFSSSWSAVTNSCTGSNRLFIIPVQSTLSGSTTFRASTPSPGGLCVASAFCNVVLTDDANGFVNQTGTSSTCGAASLVGALTVASTSFVHYECTFAPNTTLNSVQF